MKVLQVYNQYRSLFNGEEAVVERIADLIDRHGGEAQLLTRSSRGIETSFVRKASAAVSGLYNWSSYRDMVRRLRRDRPDVVHAHNLYPWFSPSVLVACRRERVPIVMMLHNHQLTCPKSDHLHRGAICQKCVGGKEYHCALQNCRGNLLESVAYAARSAFARRMNLFRKNVTLFITLSEFAKRRLVQSGFDERRVVVLPNMARIAPQPTNAAQGTYFAYAGRMSQEKGLDTLLQAAALVPECPIRLAGDGPLLNELKVNAPPNVSFVGRLEAGEMDSFYRGARCLLHTSTCFEMCPLVISEAMSYAVPVVASNLGGREELVEAGHTGLLFQPGDPRALAECMRTLWHDPQRCRQLGEAGREMVAQRFSEQLYFHRLTGIYRQAISMVNGSPSRERSGTDAVSGVPA